MSPNGEAEAGHEENVEGPSTFYVVNLEGDDDWQELLDQVAPSNDPEGGTKVGVAGGTKVGVAGGTKVDVAGNILKCLHEAGARSAIVENTYIDRDFSEEYRSFYGRLFRPYPRRTRRLHFFKTDLMPVLDRGFDTIAKDLEDIAARGEYLGFIVQRPVHDAPIARALLNDSVAGLAQSDAEATVQVRTTYTAHILGASLPIRTIPFTQQDRHISSCAQAAAWVCARHFHTRHAEPWFSMTRIRDAVDLAPDSLAAQSVPAGSEGLDAAGLQRVLRQMGRQPYFLKKPRTRRDPANLRGEPSAAAATVDFAAVLNRYVGSGIPVVVVIEKDRNKDAHAVVAVGMTRTNTPCKGATTGTDTTASFIDSFIVHDDQRGPFVKLPRDKSVDPDAPYFLMEDATLLIIPLPESVVVTAEAAELTAWQVLGERSKTWLQDCKNNASKLGSAPELGRPFFEAFKKKRVLARTYLTSGWKYQARFANNTAHPNLKSRALLESLPKLIWVTEFGILDDLAVANPAERRIYSHCVIDATSTGKAAPPILLHVPGFLSKWTQNGTGFFVVSELKIHPVFDDRPYSPRARLVTQEQTSPSL